MQIDAEIKLCVFPSQILGFIKMQQSPCEVNAKWDIFEGT